MIRVYTVDIEQIGPGPTFDDLNELIDHVRDEIEGMPVGDTLRVTVGEMTEEQFDNLKEWEGY